MAGDSRVCVSVSADLSIYVDQWVTRRLIHTLAHPAPHSYPPQMRSLRLLLAQALMIAAAIVAPPGDPRDHASEVAEVFATLCAEAWVKTNTPRSH